jgi:hypothetical protein
VSNGGTLNDGKVSVCADYESGDVHVDCESARGYADCVSGHADYVSGYG